MRLTQELRPGQLHFSIEIPPGWVVVVDTAGGALRALLAGRVSHRPDASVVTVGTADLWLKPFDLPAGSLATYAEREMARHVRQGEPSRFSDRIGGLEALGYEWTDGVMDIATWFVAPSPSVGVRVDHAISALGPLSRPNVSARAEGAILLASVTW